MIFPLIVGLLAVTGAWWLARPLMAANAGLEAHPADGARETYRRALGDLERDETAGLISAQNAALERAALARNLLNAKHDNRDAAPSVMRSNIPRAAALALLAIVPLLGGGLYLLTGGALALANRPLEARSPDIVELERLVRNLSERVTQQPDDAEGYRLLGVGLASLGRPAEAADAYRTAVQLGSKSPETLAAFGATLMEAQRGVSKEALDAFNAALQGNPDEPTALLFRAQALLQLGNLKAAREDLVRLLANAPPDAPWREKLVAHLAALDQEIAQAPAQIPKGGEAIASLDPQARLAAIQSMVEGLAARLESNPEDLEGWKKLIRSYTVLGQNDKAATARSKAQAVFKDNPQALEQLRD